MNREAKKLHMNKNGERKLPQRRDIHGRRRAKHECRCRCTKRIYRP